MQPNGANRSSGGAGKRRHPAVLVALLAVLLTGLSQSLAGRAVAAGGSIVSADFAGGSNTALVGGVLFAKSGASLTLTVVTDTDIQCVALSGAHSASAIVPVSVDATTKTWSFSVSAATGADGVRTTTITASVDAGCATADATASRPYRIDNTAPSVSWSRSLPQNQFGWNNLDFTVTWSATDAGSGVASGPTPPTYSQTFETGGINKFSSAIDRVGNSGTGSTIVKLDKTMPTITSARNPAPNVNGWNNTSVTVSFVCSDGRSGIHSCSGPTTRSANGANQVVVGNALDFADNASSVSVSVNIDKNAPTITGTPLVAANGAGWYNSDVAVDWTCVDTGGSGFAAGACDDTSITGEGVGLTTSKSVVDLAGNPSAVATSSPPVRIDRTAPVTVASPVAQWSNSDVTVGLTATDGLSGVAATHFTVDGGPDHTYGPGDVPTFDTDAAHVLEFWSVDVAGNEEAHQTLAVGVDKTAPVVDVSQSPGANADGWHNSSVVVSFACTDATSGVQSCPSDVSLSGDGADQPVSGTAFDNAGNSTSAGTTVSIDLTAPTITGAVSVPANPFGWNNTDVVVSYSCADALSGVLSCAAADTVSGEGAGQSVTGTVEDRAGNPGSVTVGGINIDKSSPTISGVASPAANPSGWNNTNVTISWSCSDELSGVQSCPPDATVSGEGAGQSAGGQAVDRADNTRSVSVGGINVDKSAPTVNVVGVVDGATYDRGKFSASCSTSDSLSGVATPAQLGHSGGPTGSLTFTCSEAVDVAGNPQAHPVSMTITVNAPAPSPTFNFGGFQRPLVRNGTNNVNAGQAVPIKFSLDGYRGMNVFAAGSPASVAYRCGAVPPTTGFEPVALNGGGLAYDASSDTYSFVWKTTKAWTGCRMLQLSFSDGSTASAYFKFG